jgi:hypothetical protein
MAEAARLDDLADSLPPPVAAESGGDDVAIVEAPTGADGPAAPDDSTSRGGDADPLDRLFAEYDERNGAGNGAAAPGPTDDDIIELLNQDAARQQQESEFQAAQQRYAGEAAQSSLELARRDHQVRELEQTVGQLQQTIFAEQQRQHRQRSKADFDAMVAPVQRDLEAEGVDVPPDYVETQLLAAVARNPELIEAHEARYFQGHDPLTAARLEAGIRQEAEAMAKAALSIANPVQRQAAERHIQDWMRRAWQAAFVDPREHRAKGAAIVRRAIDQIVKDAHRPRIDPDATADRLAIVAAMKGASGKPPPEPPVNLGRLTEGEFRKHTMERYGF